ncbi:MAG: LCP family protein [Clostridia bacterium]|nr:LCP family protein [Clostridia bacterium]
MRRPIALLLALLILLTCPLAWADKPKDVPKLSPEEIPDTPAGIKNYLLLCVDSWGGKANNLGNTDGMVLVTVDEIMQKIMLTSFIRDIWIQKEDGGFNRLSRFVPQNGHDQKAVEDLIAIYGSHFGVKVDHYIVIDWSMIQNIIDAVGGVELTIINNEAIRLKDKEAYRSSWTDPVLKGAGTYRFTGHAAVIYMRIRGATKVDGVNYDFARTGRARQVLSSIAASLADINYERAMELLDVVVNNTLVTDMSAADLLEAAQLAFELRGAPIEEMRIPISGTYESLNYTSGAGQQIDFVANREALQEFLYGGFVVREDDE